MFYFFFFQAEDGIRDYKVTGVQTCALPISSTWAIGALNLHRRLAHETATRQASLPARSPLVLPEQRANLAGSTRGYSFERAFEARKKSRAVRTAKQRPAEIATAPSPIASSSKPTVNGVI